MEVEDWSSYTGSNLAMVFKSGFKSSYQTTSPTKVETKCRGVKPNLKLNPFALTLSREVDTWYEKQRNNEKSQLIMYTSWLFVINFKENLNTFQNTSLKGAFFLSTDS